MKKKISFPIPCPARGISIPKYMSILQLREYAIPSQQKELRFFRDKDMLIKDLVLDINMGLSYAKHDKQIYRTSFRETRYEELEIGS